MANKSALSPMWKEALATTEDYQSQLNQITDWFTGASQQTQTTADYDISQAYAAYKKQTMQAMNTASMAEGTKERLAEEGRKQYESTASQINEGLEESRSDVTTQYSKLLNNWQSNLEKQADMSARVEEALWNYADMWNYTEYNNDENWYSKYYTPGQEQNRKEILERVMYGGADTGNILSNEFALDDPELYDYYTSNQDYFNKMLLGIEDAGYRGEGYNWDNRQSLTDEANKVKQELTNDNIKIDEDKIKNMTAKQQLDYYDELKQARAVENRSVYKAEEGFEYRINQYQDKHNLTYLKTAAYGNDFEARAFTDEVVSQIRKEVAEGKLKVNNVIAIPARDKQGNIKKNLTYYYTVAEIRNGEPYLVKTSKFKK